MDRDDWNRRYSTEEPFWTVEPNRFLVEETADLGERLVLIGAEVVAVRVGREVHAHHGGHVLDPLVVGGVGSGNLGVVEDVPLPVVPLVAAHATLERRAWRDAQAEPVGGEPGLEPGQEAVGVDQHPLLELVDGRAALGRAQRREERHEALVVQ